MNKWLLAITCLLAVPAFSQTAKLRTRNGVSELFNAFEEKGISFSPGKAKALFGLSNESALVQDKTETDNLGFVHYRFHQAFGGIPVINSLFIVHTKNGTLQSASGSIVVDAETPSLKNAKASLTAADAVRRALAASGAKSFAWENRNLERALQKQLKNAKATYRPNARLVYFNEGPALDLAALRLCYEVDVYATEPLERAYYYMDAATGALAGKHSILQADDAAGTAATAYSGNVTLHSSSAGNQIYTLRDSSTITPIITLHGEDDKVGSEYTSSSPNWTLSGTDQAALDAHYGVSQTNLFYAANFGRNSYDNKGTALVSYVNNLRYIDNAFWDGTSMNFCKRSTGAPGGVTGIDVCGHELTHGVTQSTCNLIYGYEPGAINESLSDIMGKSVQFWAKPADTSWILSTDMGWEIRDLSNPNSHSHPDTYRGDYWFVGDADYGGVHYNSGVGNFMFYLLVHGGSGTNDLGYRYTVTGLGLYKADQIIYRSQSVYLTPTSQYYDWRIACIMAATDLYGASSAEVLNVKNAFFAVGVGPDDKGCDAPIQTKASDTARTTMRVSWAPAAGVGYNLQYKLATASDYTTISNIKDTTYKITGLKAGFTYNWKVQVKCDNVNTGIWSYPQSFSTVARLGTVPYCESKANSTFNEYIKSVSLNGFTNNSGDNKGYGNFTNKTIKLSTNGTFTLKLKAATPGGSSEEPWAAWIDYNADGDFADAGELAGTTKSTLFKDGSITFKVPANAAAGLTRMRIQLNAPASSPCALYTAGEVEDYSIQIAKSAGLQEQDNSANPALLSLTPNSASGSTVSASLQLEQAGSVTIKISSLAGWVLSSQKTDGLATGKNTIRLQNADNLQKGVYMVVAEQNGIVIGRTQLLVNR